MSLTQALNTATSGLKVMQSAMSIVASNVANAQTPGYVRKSLEVTSISAGGVGNSVRVAAVQRELDEYLQKQLRMESAGGGYADLRASFYQRLQAIYGDPSSSSSLESVFSTFTNAIQTLVTSPDSAAARSMVLSSAQVLAQTLNSVTEDVQSLRADAESGIAAAVETANYAMQKIVELNGQLAGREITNASDAALADQRDAYVDQLAELIDIRVVKGDQGELNIFTNSGVQLVGAGASRLQFNAAGTVSATSRWDADPAQSTLGTISLVSPSGGSIDLIANKSLRSGKIAAYLEMRDNVLVEAQNQLDGLAAAMAQALSDDTVAGTPVAGGFDVDTTGWLNGDRINLTYTDPTGQHRVTIVRVDDPSVLPLADTATAGAGDRVIGVDFSGGMASVVAQLNAAFGGALNFSNTGNTLTVLDDGGANTTDVDALSMTRTATSLANGRVAIPMFTDGGLAYTGAIGAGGSQSVGFAGRISINAQLLADPSKLILYDSATQTGDPTRANFIYSRLAETALTFDPNTGMGNSTTPYSGTLPAFLQQLLSQQGQAASNAQSLAQGQDVVVNALKQRFNEASGVNVDAEMANLIALQTAYGANARVLTAVKEMLDTLLRM
ncbi:MAG: flagellar hook-associated protein FlgK [Xanthobacteraceae bacterium]|nr:flagellar hook-associated protein FlgK [Xanthobacteraceae bacterium]